MRGIFYSAETHSNKNKLGASLSRVGADIIFVRAIRRSGRFAFTTEDISLFMEKTCLGPGAALFTRPGRKAGGDSGSRDYLSRCPKAVTCMRPLLVGRGGGPAVFPGDADVVKQIESKMTVDLLLFTCFRGHPSPL